MSDTNQSPDLATERRIYGGAIIELSESIDAAAHKAGKAGLSLETIVGVFESTKIRLTLETFRRSGI